MLENQWWWEKKNGMHGPLFACDLYKKKSVKKDALSINRGCLAEAEGLWEVDKNIFEKKKENVLLMTYEWAAFSCRLLKCECDMNLSCAN